MYPSDKLPVALLFGGAGAEHEISCRSAAYVGGVFERSGVPTLYVGIDRRGAPRLCDGAEIGEDRPPVFPVRLGEESGFFRGGEILPVGSAFPILHGDRGEDGEIQGALKAAGIPFVGCGVFAGAVAADKCAAKRLAEAVGIPTVPWICSDEDDPAAAAAAAEAALSYPMICKPVGLGSSIGVRAAKDRAGFLSAYREARRHGRVLIEKLLPLAAELEVAYLDVDGGIFTPPGRVRAAGLYSYEEKYGAGSHARVDLGEDLPEQTVRLCEDCSERLCAALGARDFARIDFFLDRAGRLYFNEINTVPGMTDVSLFPRLAARAGWPPERLFPYLAARAAQRGGGA